MTCPTRTAAPGACWPTRCCTSRIAVDDGIIGKSRLQRARETFAVAAATETFAAATYRNSARLSGVLQHPDQLGEAA